MATKMSGKNRVKKTGKNKSVTSGETPETSVKPKNYHSEMSPTMMF